MKPSLRRARLPILIAVPALAALLALSACGGGDPTPTLAPGAPTPTPEPPSTPVVGTPTRTLTPTPDASDVADPSPTPTSAAPAVESPAPTATATTAADNGPFERSTGDVDGVAFVVVGEGSEATFSVDEELVNVTLPDYEAVMRATGLSGEVRLDGGASLITINLQNMTSDNSSRDRYVARRMFPDQPSASVAFGDLTPLPDGFTSGDDVETEATGTLSINGLEVPLTFAVQARDDGDVVYVLGRSSFTWDQINEPVPTARSVVSLGDEVRVEVLLALEPQPAS